MSQIGMLIRGLNWYNFRNIDGVLHPDIASDPNKMIEVDFYLDFIKVNDKDKLYKILEEYRLIDLSNPRNKEARMKVVAGKLDKLEKAKETKSVKEK